MPDAELCEWLKSVIVLIVSSDDCRSFSSCSLLLAAYMHMCCFAVIVVRNCLYVLEIYIILVLHKNLCASLQTLDIASGYYSPLKRQTTVTAYISGKQLLLFAFVFALQSHHMLETSTQRRLNVGPPSLTVVQH